MAAAVPVPIGGPDPEQSFILRNISWKDYVLLRDILDGPGLQMTYIEGVLELMSPSLEHELWKKNIARFVELFAHVRGIDLHGYGSMTFRKEAKALGVEPDECYLIGKKLSRYPEIIIEVIRTAPLLDKLDVYRVFGIPEVWVFRDGAFTVNALDRARGTYEVVPSSRLVPGLDFGSLARYAVREDTPQALREFEQQVR